MAYLSKQEYEKRDRNAARQLSNNIDVAMENGLTEEQADLIAQLCAIRHELHCNIRRLIPNNEREIKWLIELNVSIKESGLEPMSFVPLDIWDACEIGIDCLDEIFETEQVPDDEDERDAWYDKKESMIYDQWEGLNTKIEKYLGEISAMMKSPKKNYGL